MKFSRSLSILLTIIIFLSCNSSSHKKGANSPVFAKRKHLKGYHYRGLKKKNHKLAYQQPKTEKVASSRFSTQKDKIIEGSTEPDFSKSEFENSAKNDLDKNNIAQLFKNKKLNKSLFEKELAKTFFSPQDSLLKKKPLSKEMLEQVKKTKNHYIGGVAFGGVGILFSFGGITLLIFGGIGLIFLTIARRKEKRLNDLGTKTDKEITNQIKQRSSSVALVYLMTVSLVLFGVTFLFLGIFLLEAYALFAVGIGLLLVAGVSALVLICLLIALLVSLMQKINELEKLIDKKKE